MHFRFFIILQQLFDSSVLCLQCDERKIVAGCADRVIRVFDIRSGRLVSTLQGHKVTRQSNSCCYSLLLTRNRAVFNACSLMSVRLFQDHGIPLVLYVICFNITIDIHVDY